MTVDLSDLLAEHGRSVASKRPASISRRIWRALGTKPAAIVWRRQRRPAPSWRLTVLAEIDEKQGLIRPMLFIAGTPLERGRVVFELLGETGPVGSPLVAPLTVEGPGSMLVLPAFSPPEGAIGAVSSWHWNVRLESKRGRLLAHWSKRLVPANALNCEAELDL